MQRELFEKPRRRLCLFCLPRDGWVGWWGDPHDGPCGRPCIGSVAPGTMEPLSNDGLDAFVARHHSHAEARPCPHCEVSQP